jgi:hypothetical protein
MRLVVGHFTCQVIFIGEARKARQLLQQNAPDAARVRNGKRVTIT